jgi:hypothetical protein
MSYSKQRALFDVATTLATESANGLLYGQDALYALEAHAERLFTDPEERAAALRAAEAQFRRTANATEAS